MLNLIQKEFIIQYYKRAYIINQYKYYIFYTQNSKLHSNPHIKMQGQYQQQLHQILQKLHFNSIQQFLQLQPMHIDKITSRCNLHSIVIQQYLLRLHQIILKTQLIQKKIIDRNGNNTQQQILIKFGQMYPGVNFNIEEGQLLEVLGRANGGKTMLMINIAKQAIEKNIQPILLSSSISCTNQYLQQIPKQKIMTFQFEDISDLAMLIHSIGNQILNSPLNSQTQQEITQTHPSKIHTQKYILLIDTLSQIQPQDQSLQFDCSQKFRRLINIFITRTHSSIIYSYRVNNSLFNTQYKRQHHRPKCKNSKEWDGWAGKNVIVDWIGRRKEGKQGKAKVIRLVFAKGLDNKMYQVLI